MPPESREPTALAPTTAGSRAPDAGVRRRPTRKPRPKVQAAASATTGAVFLAALLRLLGVDVDRVPPELLVAAAGALATAAAYLKRDGLAGTWDRFVRGAPEDAPGRSVVSAGTAPGIGAGEDDA